MRVFLQRLGHLSAETLNGTAVGGIGRWFGWLGVEALTKIGLKARRHRGTSSRSVASTLLQAGQGAPAPPQPQALSPQERPIQMVFADPPRVVAPVPHRLALSSKPMSVQSMRSATEPAVNFCCSGSRLGCCDPRGSSLWVKGWPPGASASTSRSWGSWCWACAQFTPRVSCLTVPRRVSSSAFS
jgi:hypothetical protein